MADDENTIMVPIDGNEAEEINHDTEDSLAHELATIQQSSKKIAIIGSRNLPITHFSIKMKTAICLTRCRRIALPTSSISAIGMVQPVLSG